MIAYLEPVWLVMLILKVILCEGEETLLGTVETAAC